MIRGISRRFDPLEIGVAFNAATSLFALPIYLRLYASPGALEVIRLALLVQILPAVVFIVAGRLLARRNGLAFARRLYWIGLTIAALASLGRLVQLQVALGLPSIPTAAKVAIPMLWTAVAVALAVVKADWVPNGFGRVGPVFAIVSALFVGQLVLSSPTHTSAQADRSARGDNVFLFVFDELGRDVLMRDGEIDAGRFPNLATLAREGVSFDDATSNYSDTCQSIPSMLTGRSLPVGSCHTFFLAGDQENLLTTLDGRYELHLYGEYLRDCTDQAAHVCRGVPHLLVTAPQLAIVRHLIPPGVRIGALGDMLGTTFGTYTWTLWRELLEDVRAEGDGPRAYFVHLLLPHAPYVYDSKGGFHHSPHEYFLGLADDALAYTNYEQQIMFVDSLLGEFLAALRTAGAYETSTVVVTGDHGPRLVEPPPVSLGGVSAQTPDVPLIMKGPGITPRRRSADYQHVDFAPTVLDALGIATSLRFEGRSALRDEAPQRAKWFYSDGRLYQRDPTGRWRVAD